MKAVYLSFMLSFLFCSLLAQDNDMSWNIKSSPEVGATNIIPYECADTRFVIFAYSTKGVVKVYELNDDGSIGQLSGVEEGLPKGKWGISTFHKETCLNYLYLSLGENKSATYKLSSEGEILSTIQLSELNLDKDIEHLAHLSNGLFLDNPTCSHTWAIELDQKGVSRYVMWNVKKKADQYYWNKFTWQEIPLLVQRWKEKTKQICKN